MGIVYSSFDDLPIVLYDSVEDVGTGESNTPMFPLASGGVYDPLGSEQAVRSAMPISVKGDLVANDATDMSTQQRAWRAKRGKRGKLYRRWLDTSAVEWMYARLRNIDISRGRDNALVQPIDLQFIAESPVWNGVHHGGGWALDDGILLDTGYYLDEGDSYPLNPDTVDSGITAITLAYGGDANVTNVSLIIYNPLFGIGPSGIDITNLEIRIGPTGGAFESSWTYDNVIPAGSTLGINTGSWRVELDGVGDYDHFDLVDAEQFIDTWARLLPGGADIRVDMVGGPPLLHAATLQVSFWEGSS